MKNTKPLLLLCLFFLAGFIFSCKKSVDVQKDESQPKDVQLPSAVATQLTAAQKNLAEQNIPASIVSYQAESEISDENQLNNVRQNLEANENWVPDYDGIHPSSFSVSTIQERMQAYQRNAEAEQNVMQNMRQLVFPLIKKGQKVLDILWQVKGNQFHTKCIYVDSGIVYDNMLSNINLVQVDNAPAEELKLKAEGETANSRTADNNTAQRKQYSFTATVLNYTIKWLWGSTRGKIIIKHYIIWNGYNYIYDHGGTASAWMSVGSASARWRNNRLYRRSRSKMAWAYGWATPTASFSIKFNSSKLTFSTSVSGVGSKGSGSGVHTIYF